MAVGPSRESDALVGEALARGWLTLEQVTECRRAQAKMEKMGVRLTLDEVLVKKRAVSPKRIEAIEKDLRVARVAFAVPGYELLSRLGKGGMGTVLKARQLLTGRLVAIKLMSKSLAADVAMRERFLREARASAKLNHPHIIQGIDFGERNGVPYFVMEYVEGQTLRELVREKGRIPEFRTLKYGVQIAKALDHAHEKGIIHRDVKPENILVDVEDCAKLVDLGLAKNLSGDASLTQTGLAVGTPHYSSPEQVRGDQEIGPATDLYALGATLYHISIGHPLFKGDTSHAIMAAHVNGEAPDPRSEVPHLSENFCRILRCLLAKDPKKRCSAKELVEDLSALQESQPLLFCARFMGKSSLARLGAGRKGRKSTSTERTGKDEGNGMPSSTASRRVAPRRGLQAGSQPRRSAHGIPQKCRRRGIAIASALSVALALIILGCLALGGGREKTSPEGKLDLQGGSFTQKTRGEPVKKDVPAREGKPADRLAHTAKTAVPSRPEGRFSGSEGHTALEPEPSQKPDPARGRVNNTPKEPEAGDPSDPPNEAGDGPPAAAPARAALHRVGEFNCPRCGKANAREARFCKFCGTKINRRIPASPDATSLACPRCRKGNSPEAKFCRFCGERIADAAKEERVSCPSKGSGKALVKLVDPSRPNTTKTPAESRQPVPTGEKLQEAIRRVRNIFKNDLASPATEARAMLAVKLLKQAEETRDDPVVRYALLRESRHYAEGAGEVSTAFKAINSLVRSWKIDPLKEKAKAVQAAARSVRTIKQARKVAEASLAICDQAVTADDFAIAERAASNAEFAARRSRDASLYEHARKKRNKMRGVKNAFLRARKAFAALRENQSDPEANTVVGRYLCLFKGDWDKGLSLLAKGKDARLKAAAERDLTNPTEALAQVAVGDGWWDLAGTEREFGPAKGRLRARTRDWYERAAPRLTGLAKMKVGSRLAQISRTTGVFVEPGNVALASNGTTVSGATGGSELLDGNTTKYSDGAGFAIGSTACEWIITFPKVYRLREIRLLLFDRDPKRFYRYTIEVSTDGRLYELLVDRSDGEWRGWQALKFSPRAVKFIKVRGLHCSANQWFAVVELEAYSFPPPPLQK